MDRRSLGITSLLAMSLVVVLTAWAATRAPSGGGGNPRQAAAPSFSPIAGTYTSAQSVTISSATSGADIRYTLNGSTPTCASTVYSGPVGIASNTTLKAIACKSGMTNSTVTSGDYVIAPLADAPTFSPAPATYTSVQSVTISSTTSGADIHYTVDGGTPTCASTAYSGPVSISSNTTLKAIACKSGMTQSTVTSGDYVIVLPVDAPTFWPAPGTYTSPQSVTISSATSGADIHYTLNGSTPSCASTTYSGPVGISSNTTLKAIACKSGMTESTVTSGDYLICSSSSVWNSYDAMLHPTATNSITLANGCKTQWEINQGTGALATVTNGVLAIDTSSDVTDQTSFRHNDFIDSSGQYPKRVTLLARVTTNQTTHRSVSFDFNMADVGVQGARVHMAVEFDRVRLFNIDNSAHISRFTATQGTHIYQVAITLTSPTAGNVKVFVDGNDAPVIDFTGSNFLQTTSAGTNALRFGDVSATAAYAGAVDWVIWRTTGAFTPSQVKGTLPVAFNESPGYLAWNIYDASLHPTATGSIVRADGTTTQWSLGAGSGSFAVASGGILNIDTRPTVADQSDFRITNVVNSTGIYPKTFTAIARVTGTTDAEPVRVFHLEGNFADTGVVGGRVTLAVRQGLLELLNVAATPASSVFSGPVTTSGTHTYQLAITLTSATSANIKVYMDGNTTPVMDHTETNLRQTTAVGTNSFRFGDSSTNNSMNTGLDWLVWTASGAYTPADVVGLLPRSLTATPGYECAPNALGWNIYDASLFPTTTNSVLRADGCNSQWWLNLGSSSFASVSSGVLTINTTSSGANQSAFIYPQIVSMGSTYPKTFTLATRIVDLGVGGKMDFDIALGASVGNSVTNGPRLYFVVQSGVATITVIDGTNSVWASIDNTGTHIFQVAVTVTSPTEATMRVYRDGNTTPIIDHTQTGVRQSQGNYLRIGDHDNTTSTINGSVDWVLWTDAGAFDPTALSGSLAPLGLANTPGY